MLISVSDTLAGYKIIEYKDVVLGVGNSMFDGELYRGAAIRKASTFAEKLGANAVINLNIIINNVGEALEATVYGNAVVVEPMDTITLPKAQKVNLDSFLPKSKTEGSDTAEIIDLNGYKFVVCPKCKSKYKADIDENGNIKIKGFEDVDKKEPGLQVFCLRCGSKFTVPEKI